MFNLLPQIILFVAVGAIVALIAKSVPKVKKFSKPAEEIPVALKMPSENKFLKKIPLEKLNDEFNRLLEKSLRKMRILMMRADTSLQRRLESLKDSNRPKTIFKMEEKDEENIPDVIAEAEVLIEREGAKDDASVIEIGELDVVNEINNLEKAEEVVIAPIIEKEAEIKLSKKRRKKREENNQTER
ncbi:MAG TPA: hypothetical protein P5524_02480 [Candidatus Paceibacterota bacterium]|nr:hypothetical protein [Candidatus Paceibacterota bacterium]